jgi:glycosyltransferase involved in cell wall biosynthesis
VIADEASPPLPMNLVIAENNLTDHTGHYYEYARVLRDHVVGQGGQSLVLANRTVSQRVIDEVQAIPCFRLSSIHFFKLPVPFLGRSRTLRDLWNRRSHDRIMYEDLCAAQSLLPSSADTYFLFPTVTHQQLNPILRWSEQLAPESFGGVFIVLRYGTRLSETEDTPEVKHYRWAFSHLDRSPVFNKIHLLSDSALLALEYARHTRSPVHLLPIPHGAQDHLQNGAENPQTDSRPPRLTFLGIAAASKGFDYLPGLFERLQAALASGTVEAEIQANLGNRSEASMKAILDDLRQRKILLHEGPLSKGQYDAMLERSGIVLLPYSHYAYSAQTSGVFCEAVARGKPVVVPKDTWMSHELQKHGAGVTFERGNQDDFYAAVAKALHDYPQLCIRAREQAAGWAREHCPQQYLRVLDTCGRSHDN